MKPVNQRITIKGKGDCLRASVASLLEMDYESIPDFLSYSQEEWFPVFHLFLKKHDYVFQGSFYPNGKDQTMEELMGLCMGVDGCYIASGPSPRFENTSHAIIINTRGEIIFDPHPSRAGVSKITSVFMIDRAEK